VPGLEGVVAERRDSPYLPGERQWIKVKRQRTADCAVIGVTGDWSRPSLVLGLRHADGLLHHLGRIRPVICPVQRMRCPPLVPGQSVPRRHSPQLQRGTFLRRGADAQCGTPPAPL
jgi:hypothetical protein